MDRQAITSRSELEHILFDDSAVPKALPLSLLEHITSGFSDDKQIGDGGFARVYKGMLDNGMVAVKKLFGTVDLDEKKFSEEIRCLMKAKHKNIVRFLGYCSDTQGKIENYEGKLVLADVRQRLLCFEYLPNGSLDKKITDASCGLEWSKRYKIINGICDGLYYLHQNHIVHLDLKPANILLDDNMMPKIADFGLSRCFDEKQSRATTSNMLGTIGYLAPEFYTRRQITFKLDIYSLGMIIIEILTGEKGYADIDNVLERWRSRLEKSQEDKQLVQVRVCTEIAIECTDFNPAKRPDAHHIIDRLGATRNADEFATETELSSSSSIPKLVAVSPGPTIVHENTMANELKKSTAELYSMTDQIQRFSSMPDDSSNVRLDTDIRETTSDVEEALIIGRTEEKQKIVATLSGSITPEVTILPIYGFGGIGKTTLAQLVFNDSQFSDYSRVWVYVSQNLDLKKIGNSIISQLPKESHVAEKQMIHNESNSIISSKEINVAEKQMIHNKLRDLLADKKILIVLDDVWEKNPNTLKSLKAMLRLGAGSMVTVIVTTRDEAIAREICHTVGPYKLDTLTNKSCWKIIKQQTAFKDRVDKKQLKHIGKEIATKCGGVALAAQSLGYTLKGKTSDEWESVRDNYIWNLSTSEDPSSTDHEVLASLLLSYSRMPYWLKLCFSYCGVFPKGRNIAKYDLIHQWIALGFTEPSRIFDTMQLCEKYVTQLLGMSFLQYSKTSSSDTQRDKDVTFFTMHDLVHDLAKEILAHQINTGGNECRYALLTNCSSALQLFVAFPANIMALHFRDCGKQELCGGAFSPAKCLRVLDLSECFIQKLPDCIGQLKQLRFLHAPRIQEMIPNCITELSELNYLNLRDSHNISALPESIGDMKALMHLDLSRCYWIRELPVSFAELKQLVHLDLSHCNMSEAEALGGCTKLQYLNLSATPTLYWQKEHIRRLPKIISNLIKLRYLNLSGCMGAMESASENEIVKLLDTVCTLPNLEHLDLSNNLGHRDLSNNLEYFSIPESIGNLMKLHTLDLFGCFRLKLPADFVVHASGDKFSRNIRYPEVLTIYRLENVKSAEEARSIKLMQRNIIELRFEWTVVARRSVDDKEVLEKLVPPSSVQRLYISGYSSVSIPDWLMGIRQHLPNLSQLYFCDFPNCNNLPSLGQLAYLRELGLCCMESLEEWNTAYTSGEPMLEALTIDQCAKLRIKPCPPRAKVLRIIDCDNMLSSWGESSSNSGASSSPITKLIVKNCKVPMHQWRLLHQLPVLRSLTITGCSDLTTSPKIIQQLSSLVSLSLDQAELPRWLTELTSLPDLRLSECRSMTSLPQWLGKLTFLKELHIMRCEGIRSLPNSIQQLTKLENLDIRGCLTLVKWCESEENKMKLAHIRGIVPRSLMAQEEDTPKIILAAPIHGTTVMDEVDPDVLYSAVMNMPGFAEESLLVALSQLMDNTAQGSAYMAMSEEDRVSWLMNFLKKY